MKSRLKLIMLCLGFLSLVLAHWLAEAMMRGATSLHLATFLALVIVIVLVTIALSKYFYRQAQNNQDSKTAILFLAWAIIISGIGLIGMNLFFIWEYLIQKNSQVTEPVFEGYFFFMFLIISCFDICFPIGYRLGAFTKVQT